MMRLLRSVLLLVGIAGAGACASVRGGTGGAGRGSPSRESAGAQDTAERSAAYDAAIADAAVFRQANVRPLLRVPSGADSIDVVLWALTPFAASYASETVTTVWGDVWVTLASEVRDSCRHFPEGEQLLRLQQLLGLRPDTLGRTFVTLRVGTRDLFRPCPRRDVTAASCPDSVLPPGTDSVYTAWFLNQALSSYRVPGGFPWTRLGYTYDWRPGSPRYGASEFVVPQGRRVHVLGRWTTRDYCRAG